MFATDTHLIQQGPGRAVIVHDLDRLENGKELMATYDKGQLADKILKVKYNDEKGAGSVVVPDPQRLAAAKKQALEWADKNITNAKSREMVMKHIETCTKSNSHQAIEPLTKSREVSALPQQKAPTLEKAK